jgi:hypothetical protein
MSSRTYLGINGGHNPIQSSDRFICPAYSLITGSLPSIVKKQNAAFKLKRTERFLNAYLPVALSGWGDCCRTELPEMLNSVEHVHLRFYGKREGLRINLVLSNRMIGVPFPY